MYILEGKVVAGSVNKGKRSEIIGYILNQPITTWEEIIHLASTGQLPSMTQITELGINDINSLVALITDSVYSIIPELYTIRRHRAIFHTSKRTIITRENGYTLARSGLIKSATGTVAASTKNKYIIYKADNWNDVFEASQLSSLTLTEIGINQFTHIDSVEAMSPFKVKVTAAVFNQNNILCGYEITRLSDNSKKIVDYNTAYRLAQNKQISPFKLIPNRAYSAVIEKKLLSGTLGSYDRQVNRVNIFSIELLDEATYIFDKIITVEVDIKADRNLISAEEERDIIGRLKLQQSYLFAITSTSKIDVLCVLLHRSNENKNYLGTRKRAEAILSIDNTICLVRGDNLEKLNKLLLGKLEKKLHAAPGWLDKGVPLPLLANINQRNKSTCTAEILA